MVVDFVIVNVVDTSYVLVDSNSLVATVVKKEVE